MARAALGPTGAAPAQQCHPAPTRDRSWCSSLAPSAPKEPGTPEKISLQPEASVSPELQEQGSSSPCDSPAFLATAGSGWKHSQEVGRGGVPSGGETLGAKTNLCLKPVSNCEILRLPWQSSG